MLVVYDSLTGNVARFVKKLKGFEIEKVSTELKIREPFVMVTYTIGFGEVPLSTQKFLEKNYKHLRGVASSGNRIWGDNYTKAAVVISKQYGVPIVHRFELSGTEKDVLTFTQEVGMLDK